MKTVDGGIFISFEGGEGAGKSSLVDSLYKALTEMDFSVLKTREPGGTVLGEEVRHWLLKKEFAGTIGDVTELFLFLAARAQHVEEVISPALKEGKVVLCDRFNDSTVVYQGDARGLGVEKVSRLCEEACQGVLPSVTFYLDIPPEIGLLRTRTVNKDSAGTSEVDRLEGEGLSFHSSVREGFHRLSLQFPERFMIIDSQQSQNQVFQQVLQNVQERLRKRSFSS